MAKENKKETTPVVLTQENVVEQAKAGNIMTADMVNKMNEELKDEKDKQIIACGFTVTDIIVDEFARTKDDILELETLDEKKKILTIQMPVGEGKREAKEFKVGDVVPPVISYIEFDTAVEKLEKKLREKRNEIEKKHEEEVKTIKQAAGEYYCSDWSYNLKIVTMDGFQNARGW